MMKILFLPLLLLAQYSGDATFLPSEVINKDQVKLVENYEKINSFDDLLQQFKGRTVYIDLWATWCRPCIAQFEHKGDLNAFAKENDIDVLYISMDKDDDEVKWFAFIEDEQLAGYHMRASSRLAKEIRNRFTRERDGRTLFGIPYYIIAKDGQITLKNAPRPSSKDRLYNELRKHI